MKTSRFKFEAWQMLLFVLASAVAVVLLNSLSFGISTRRVFDSLIHTFFIAISVSIGILFLAPRIYKFQFLKRIAILIPAIFVTTLIGIILTRVFLIYFYNGGLDFLTIFPGKRTIIFSLIISYVFGFSGYLYLHSQSKLKETKERLRQKELDETKAKSLAIQAQLASLESRIHPHFLFNTLNSIAALIKENPDQAEKIVEKLSALLRYSLEFQPHKLVTLREELKITRDYLEIEATRFARKLVFNFEVDENITEEKLPAFSLQTLVENSIKHVAARRSAQTEINISVYNSDGVLRIEVTDNGNGFSEDQIKPGHGLDTLRRRLKNIFGDMAELKIIESGKVCLEIRA